LDEKRQKLMLKTDDQFLTLIMYCASSENAFISSVNATVTAFGLILRHRLFVTTQIYDI